jgi:iron(III) transport system substrate-binding protein
MIKRAVIILALVGIVALPFMLRPKRTADGKVDATVVIITSHNEAIRHEYGIGFRRWYRERTGKDVFIDWRVIGGTSEIARFLESEYVASFKNLWVRKLGRPWSADVLAAFANARLAADAPEVAQEARRVFLASEAGCGIDVFFGGGSYDAIRQAEAGRLVPSRLLQTRPEWFTDDVLPASYAGEPFWDREGRWLGNVLSSYGILCNRDALQRLGITQPPAQWQDLTDPRYIGEIALADPTKSSSIAKAFENLIQQKMQDRLTALQAANPGNPATETEARAVREGWVCGLQIIQRIGANSRYFTDSSQKPPIDVSQGDSAVGICIDFYGRYQAEAVRRRDDSARLEFVTPRGGTVSSVDPIGLLRGAPHREVAEDFIEYTLSMEGQKLWNFKVGVEGGPARFPLRRLPIRRDFYAHQEWGALRSDPEAEPFEVSAQLVYQPAWTGGIFREMAFIIRVMALDTHPELVRAWRAIAAAGSPPEALAVLGEMDAVSYDKVTGPIRQALNAKNKVEEIRLANALGATFREQYRRAEEIARAAAARANAQR